MSSRQQLTSDVVGDVKVDIDDDRSMTTYVKVSFDNAVIAASDELNNATLLLHNDPVITPLSDVVKVYSNTSQIIQIQVCVDNRYNV